ncbi:radical SAM/SPASM domain-containing protein [Streptomyces sp. NPDC005271]|uniref:radical SAM/SPASM domain-containing protein n=1 Tax=unclassified Streptomyces TaxID=2593676 RepID=UPI0033A31B0F
MREAARCPDDLPGRLAFLWLELTAKCQLECAHCYADSGPWGTHGTMTREDWIRVIDEAHDLGVRTILFIGGEPTLHPHLRELIERAARPGVDVRVLSNLVHVPHALWEALELPGVRVSVSYYSHDAAEHDALTRRRGSHARTTENLRKAAERGVQVSAMVVKQSGDDGANEISALAAIGVTRHAVDRVRYLGRAAAGSTPNLSELCGQCSGALLAVGPDGMAFPCPMSRWLTVGNVREGSLASVAASARLSEARQTIAGAFDPAVTGRPPVEIRDECFGADTGGGCGP